MHKLYTSTVAVALIAFLPGCAKKMPAPPQPAQSRMMGYVGGGGGARAALREDLNPTVQAAGEQKIIRSATLDLVVGDVRKSAEEIQKQVQSLKGYVESAEFVEGDSGVRSGKLVVRVPAEQLDAALATFKRLAQRVERENVQAQDVTREFVDTDARLRNLRATETQYLQILRTAKTVKDTLDVSEKLAGVRGEIERTQGEFNYLQHQIAMSAVSLSLRQPYATTIGGIEWRPLNNAKSAVRDLLTGLSDWADSIISVVINLPLILLWIATVVFAAAIVVKVVRWFWRRFFPGLKLPWRKKPAQV